MKGECYHEQSRAEQSRAEQSRAEQSRAEQSRAEQVKESAFLACPHNHRKNALLYFHGRYSKGRSFCISSWKKEV